MLFRAGDHPDGAYVLVKGAAELRWPDARPGDKLVSEVGPDRIVGDLTALRNETRRFNLVATEKAKALRIGSEELRAVVENDVHVAHSLLCTVAGYLETVGGMLRDERRQHAEHHADGTSHDHAAQD